LWTWWLTPQTSLCRWRSCFVPGNLDIFLWRKKKGSNGAQQGSLICSSQVAIVKLRNKPMTAPMPGSRVALRREDMSHRLDSLEFWVIFMAMKSWIRISHRMGYPLWFCQHLTLLIPSSRYNNSLPETFFANKKIFWIIRRKSDC
jgi:hypothetical protein